MTNSGEHCLDVAGWGAARADLGSIAALRKAIPAWAPKDTPGHFLKHADEQTVVAVAALDKAIQSRGGRAEDYRQWAIIAAPRFIGRIAGAVTFHRYSGSGGSSISPHLIPQHSLHSVSGALSILLATRRPNFGIGGTSNSLAEGLLAALTFPDAGSKGTWLIATGWDPEPQLDNAGQCGSQPVCHAVAIALESAAGSGACGTLRLATFQKAMADSSYYRWNKHAAEVCRALETATMRGAASSFAWQSPVGMIALEVKSAAAQLPLAA